MVGAVHAGHCLGDGRTVALELELGEELELVGGLEDAGAGVAGLGELDAAGVQARRPAP